MTETSITFVAVSAGLTLLQFGRVTFVPPSNASVAVHANDPVDLRFNQADV